MNNEPIDEKTQQLIDSLKQSINYTVDTINKLDLQKAVDDHIAMEELKSKMGVK
jgi:hypothetical protein